MWWVAQHIELQKINKKTHLQNVYFVEEHIQLTTGDVNIITDYSKNQTTLTIG
jgi:hypothetical protein